MLPKTFHVIWFSAAPLLSMDVLFSLKYIVVIRVNNKKLTNFLYGIINIQEVPVELSHFILIIFLWYSDNTTNFALTERLRASIFFQTTVATNGRYWHRDRIATLTEIQSGIDILILDIMYVRSMLHKLYLCYLLHHFSAYLYKRHGPNTVSASN